MADSDSESLLAAPDELRRRFSRCLSEYLVEEPEFVSEAKERLERAFNTTFREPNFHEITEVLEFVLTEWPPEEGLLESWAEMKETDEERGFRAFEILVTMTVSSSR